VPSVASSYIRIVADFSQFRREAVTEAIDAGHDSARSWAASFRTTMRTEMANALTFNVAPILDLRAFRAQYQLFRNVYLQDQSFLVNPQLDTSQLHMAWLLMQRNATTAGDRSGASAGTALNKALFLKILAGGAAIVPALKTLAGLVSILGELVIAAGAVGAAIPAMVLTVLSAVVALKLAFAGVGDAFKEAFSGDDPKKLAEALEKLAPPARAFVKEVVGFKPQLKALQQDVQASFFQPLLGGFAQLMRSPALGLVRNLLKGVATDAGVAGRGILGVLTNAAKSGELLAIFTPIRGTLSEFFKVIPGLVQAFLTLARVGGGFAQILLDNVTIGLSRFVDLIERAAADGSLAEFFERGMDILSTFGTLLRDIGSIFMSVFSAISANGEGALGVIGALVHQLAAFLKTAEGSQALQQIGQILAVLGGVVSAVLVPLLPVAAKLISVLAGPLVQAIAAITPALNILATALADMLMPVLEALAPVFSELAAIVARFLSSAMAELAIHIQKMTPLAIQMAETLGPQLIPVVQALGDVLLALVPLIPAISDAIIELVPLVVMLIPLLVAWLQWTAQLITWLATFVTWIVKVVAALVMFYAEAYSNLTKLRGVFDSVWTWIRDRVLAPMQDWMFNKIPHAFRTGVDLIEFWWNRLKGVARAPVDFLVNTVVNKGIIGTFNQVAGWIPGLDKLKPIDGFAGGGHFHGRLPGAPSDVDNMLANSPYGPIALAGGEFVVKAKEANRPTARMILQFINDGGLRGFAAGGLIGAITNPAGWVKDQIGGMLDKVPGGGFLGGAVKGIGNKFVDGLINFVKSKLSFMGSGGGEGFPPWPFAHPGRGGPSGDSGVWHAIVNLIKSTGPISGSFGNAFRPGDPLWHGAGRAVDWMGFNQDLLASFFMNMRPRVLELIHRTGNRDYAVTRGKDMGKFSEGLMEAHRNHIHIAMSGGGSLQDLVARVMDTGGWMMPGWNPPTFNGTGKPEAVIPDGMSVGLSDATIEKLARAIAAALTGGMSSTRRLGRTYA
jgi:hypothetical protein